MVKVKESEIHGRGVFAERDFMPGQIVERCHYLIVSLAINATRLDRYVYSAMGLGVGGNHERVVIFGQGMVYNHSDTPNVRFEISNGWLYVIALRDIRKGEELFNRYREKVWLLK